MENLRNSQNFIHDEGLVRKLLGQVKIDPSNTVLDIGAGKGVITKVLAQKFADVIAYEKDPYVASILRQEIGDDPKVQIIEADFLRERLPKEPYSVFSNIPFDKTSDIINKLVFSNFPPQVAYLVVQKEAAKRYLGFGEGKLLSLLLQPVYDLKIIYSFQKTDFTPAPSVDSVLFSIEKRKNPEIAVEDLGMYADFVSYVLTQQKPSLWFRVNKLFTKEQYKRLSQNIGFDPDVTAKVVPYETWIKLFEYYKNGVEEKKKLVTVHSFLKYLRNKDKQKKVHRTKIRPVRDYSKNSFSRSSHNS